MSALRTAAITLVLIVGCTATVAACAFLSPVLGVVVAVVTVMALIGVGEWLNRPEPPVEDEQQPETDATDDDLLAVADAAQIPALLPGRRVGVHSRQAVAGAGQPTTKLRVVGQ